MTDQISDWLAICPNNVKEVCHLCNCGEQVGIHMCNTNFIKHAWDIRYYRNMNITTVKPVDAHT